MRRGPGEDLPWPTRLRANVVRPGPDPAIHGYATQSDLARHYSLAELMLTALRGEPPDTACGRRFEVAAMYLAPIAVSEAPCHAATLARICSAAPGSVLGIAALGLSESSRALIDRHAALLAWLDAGGRGEPPAGFSADPATTSGERDGLARLRTALASDTLALALIDRGLGLEAVLLGLLHGCGLRQPWQLAAALVVAQMAVVAAEAFAAQPGRLGDYPLNLPRFGYVEDGDGC